MAAAQRAFVLPPFFRCERLAPRGTRPVLAERTVDPVRSAGPGWAGSVGPLAALARASRAHAGVWLLAALVASGPAVAGCDPQTGDDPRDAAVPDVEACEAARGWSRTWAGLEDEVVARIDDARDRGADCGDAGKLPVAPPLEVNGALVCAARVHALSMATRGFTGHVDPDGVDPIMRAEAAGYDGTIVEHWAAGPDDPRALVQELWLRSPLHCADLVTRDFIEIGVGHVEVADGELDHVWVVVLGAP